MIEICLGRHITDIGESIGFSRVPAENFRRAARLGNKPREYADSGAFSRAVRTDKSEGISLGDREVNIIYPPLLAVEFRQRACCNRVHSVPPLLR